MSRNDQVIRQWFLLQKLGSERGATLQDLAAALPEDCFRHPRTIRRDLEALDAAHFPLLTERSGGPTSARACAAFPPVPPASLFPTQLMASGLTRRLIQTLDGAYLNTSPDA